MDAPFVNAEGSMLNPINALLEIVLPEELFAYGEVPRRNRASDNLLALEGSGPRRRRAVPTGQLGDTRNR